MSYTKEQYDTQVTIDFKTLNTEQALALLSILKGKDSLALLMFFKSTLNYIKKETNEVRREELIEAHPYILKLINLADKFNQRDGWWLKDQCVLTHDKIPYNNLETIITVDNGEIKIRKSSKRCFIEIMGGGKYEGNPEYFVETYKEDILKAAPFLIP